MHQKIYILSRGGRGIGIHYATSKERNVVKKQKKEKKRKEKKRKEKYSQEIYLNQLRK